MQDAVPEVARAGVWFFGTGWLHARGECAAARARLGAIHGERAHREGEVGARHAYSKGCIHSFLVDSAMIGANARLV